MLLKAAKAKELYEIISIFRIAFRIGFKIGGLRLGDDLRGLFNLYSYAESRRPASLLRSISIAMMISLITGSTKLKFSISFSLNVIFSK
jgi:hypothetical protein